MQKIISVFQRNYDGDRLIRDEVVPGAEWVLAGEGMATRKWDGTSCMLRDGVLYKRYDAKQGKQLPEGFIPAQEPDEITGHHPGWLKVGSGPEDKWHREAFGRQSGLFDGTYELCGPHIQGNPECFILETLVPHGDWFMPDFPRHFAAMKEWLGRTPMIEGVVFWHSDGRMAKVKAKDFGIKRVKHATV